MNNYIFHKLIETIIDQAEQIVKTIPEENLNQDSKLQVQNLNEQLNNFLEYQISTKTTETN